jgi:hypothetical protein
VSKKTWMWLAAAVLIVAPAARVAAQDTTAAPAAEAAAEEPEKSWSVDVGFDYADQYIFRGFNLLGEDQEVLVPHVAVTMGNWSVWSYAYGGNFDTETGESHYGEIDFGADYTWTLGQMSLTAGALTYQYTGEVERGLGYGDTEELYLIASWDVLLAPTISYYHDIDAVDGGYLQLGVSHSFALGDKVSLDLSGAVGIDNKYNGDESFKANDLLFGVNIPWQVSDSFSLHAQVQRSIALSVLDDAGQPDETIYTIGAGLSF